MVVRVFVARIPSTDLPGSANVFVVASFVGVRRAHRVGVDTPIFSLVVAGAFAQVVAITVERRQIIGGTGGDVAGP